uniref:Unknown protein 4 (Fragments) n=1 Tax=Lonomia obliqua TaxID=304329 RepID=UP04_LONON|nr:RecName: Full=Unknown protein 4 [Lonomia obliqua]
IEHNAEEIRKTAIRTAVQNTAQQTK